MSATFEAPCKGVLDKGIILTTGTFTADAQREASRDGVPIELVDGQKLFYSVRWTEPLPRQMTAR